MAIFLVSGCAKRYESSQRIADKIVPFEVSRTIENMTCARYDDSQERRAIKADYRCYGNLTKSPSETLRLISSSFADSNLKLIYEDREFMFKTYQINNKSFVDIYDENQKVYNIYFYGS